MRHGGGILYNADGSVAYNGEWKKGLPDGIGQSTKEDGQIVEGKFIQGLFSEIIH